MLRKIGIVILFLGVIWSCNRAEYKCEDCVVQYAASDPKQLTPFNATDPTASIIFNHIFQTLIHFDYQTNQLIPVLAKTLPTIKTTKDGKIEVQFEIHETANWDDGTAITGEDVAFSLKVIKCPFTDNQYLKTQFSIIERINISKDNPKRFSIIFSEPTMMVENLLTDLYILPKQIYDSEGLLNTYSVFELSYKSESELQDEKLIEFGELYNSTKFQKEIVNGSGAYRLATWNSNTRVILERKENWWGKNLNQNNQWFQANLKELVFEILDDSYDGYKMLRREHIDVMNDMPIVKFAQNWYPDSSDYRQKYHVFTAPTYAYDYIGINLKSPKLSDINVRQALAHLMDIDKLIDEACYGFADKVMSFTHPSLEELQNTTLQPYEYNLIWADSLLNLAGWQDLDSNGVREKVFVIDSVEEVINFRLIINYNIGNERRKIACELLQEAAAKIGVEIVVEPLELVSLLENLKTNQFDLYVGGWVASPKLSDPKEIWHTESANGGSNYVYFGNEESDEVIDEMRQEMNPKKRAGLYCQLHQMIHNEIPYIFLISQQKRIVIDKKFQHVYGCGMNPGYWTPGFTYE
ncbi:MAG: ABC transporter substrate-binding protein [Saprospiraceae bacterium]